MLEQRKRKIAVVTGIRSEYSILYPLIKRIHKNPSLDLKLFVVGAHLSKSFGLTVREIENDGFPIEERIENLIDSDSGGGRVKGAAVQLLSLVDAFIRVRPDIVVAPFDREEAMTVALAGSYLNIPVAHLGAGDKVIGNVDDYIRHAVTKLAHLHFTATEKNRRRVIRMGEEAWRVHCVGNMGIDKYRMVKSMSKDDLSKRLQIDMNKRPILVLIFNPLSSEIEQAGNQMEIIMGVIDRLKYQTIIIRPNSDAGSRDIVRVIEKHGQGKLIRIFNNLSKEIFVNLMRQCDALIGNSSCGILEAPFLKLPVVNIGGRQKEREHADNVLFVDFHDENIEKAIKKVVDNGKFKRRLKSSHNPYGDGHVSEKIVKVLSTIKLDKKLLQKKITY